MATCGEVLARMLERYGIDTIFGIPGTHTIELYRGLPATGLRHITPRHEQGAGFMADGYARVTGRPACCVTVSGPGAWNIGAAMGQALQDSIPMLVISADNATWQRNLGEGRLHESPDLDRVMAANARWSHCLARPQELPRVLARAFGIFASQRPGPVHISLPQDVITADGDGIDDRPWPLPSRPAPAPAPLQEAAALLNQAQRPVIAAGGGCADVGPLLQQLAEALDAPTTLTHNAKGLLPSDHPLRIAGSPSLQPVRTLYQQADLVLGIGTEFSETDYDFFFDGGFHLGAARLLRIDIDPAQLARQLRPTLGIVADAALAIEALLPHLERRPGGDGEQRAAQANQGLASLDHPGYQAVLDCIKTTLADPIVIGDSTQPAYFAASQYHPDTARSLASAATGYGTLGYALPAAVGARLGRADRAVVCLIGDGGLQFCIGELAAAVEAQVPLAVLVWNNQGYSMIAQNFRDAGMAPIACDIYTPDILAIARGYGCEAIRAVDTTELASALVASRQGDRPTVIELVESDFIEP